MSALLESYYPIADAIAGMFGSNCEVAIHDLTHPQNSVVYVANGTVTGRKPGQTFEHLVKQVLLNKNFKNDSTINYTFETEDGRKIKSSSVLIRDESSKVIGMLCINYDLTLSYSIHSAFEQFLPKEDPPKQESAEDAAEQPLASYEVNQIIDTLIDHIIGDVDVSSLKRKDNVALIEFMEQKGVFLVKGAMEKVAERLGVSRVTIYSYLDEIKNRKQKSAEKTEQQTKEKR